MPDNPCAEPWRGAHGCNLQLKNKPMVTNGGFTSHFTILQYGN